MALRLGLCDADYVDAYFGPEQWRPSDDDAQEPFPAEVLRSKAGALIEGLGQVESGTSTGLEKLRYAYLSTQLSAIRARIDLLAGQKMSFDEESKALYDVVAPAYDEAHFQGILRQLDEVLPGDEDLYSRFNSFRVRFTIGRDKLREVLGTAIEEYRKRTLEHIPLLADERFDLQFVGGKAWYAYAMYQGDSLSLIEINTDMPSGVAQNMINFFEQYRSYVVNYTVGRRLVADYIERHCGTDKTPARRWQLFQMLLSTPQTPSGLSR